MENNVNYPEIYSNEFIVNIENVRLTLVTQESSHHMYPRPIGVVKHFHTSYEMFLCQKGEIYADVEGQEISFKAGESLIIPPKMSHALTGAAEGSFQDSLYFNISSNGQKSTFDLYKIVSGIFGDAYCILTGMDELSLIMKAIRKVCEKKNYYKISILVHAFLMKIVELTGNIPEVHEGAYSDNLNLRVHNIHIFINKHLTESMSLEELASLLRLSARQTSRIIKENFGCTFKELVTKLRMEKAGKLLLQTKYKVSEIAEKVGFSSERGFYTAFKNQFGCLPKEYRKKNENVL